MSSTLIEDILSVRPFIQVNLILIKQTNFTPPKPISSAISKKNLTILLLIIDFKTYFLIFLYDIKKSYFLGGFTTTKTKKKQGTQCSLINYLFAGIINILSLYLFKKTIGRCGKTSLVLIKKYNLLKIKGITKSK